MTTESKSQGSTAGKFAEGVLCSLLGADWILLSAEELPVALQRAARVQGRAQQEQTSMSQADTPASAIASLQQVKECSTVASASQRACGENKDEKTSVASVTAAAASTETTSTFASAPASDSKRADVVVTPVPCELREHVLVENGVYIKYVKSARDVKETKDKDQCAPAVATLLLAEALAGLIRSNAVESNNAPSNFDGVNHWVCTFDKQTLRLTEQMLIELRLDICDKHKVSIAPGQWDQALMTLMASAQANGVEPWTLFFRNDGKAILGGPRTCSVRIVQDTTSGSVYLLKKNSYIADESETMTAKKKVIRAVILSRALEKFATGSASDVFCDEVHMDIMDLVRFKRTSGAAFHWRPEIESLYPFQAFACALAECHDIVVAWLNRLRILSGGKNEESSCIYVASAHAGTDGMLVVAHKTPLVLRLAVADK
jgi:hypothetical protein